MHLLGAHVLDITDVTVYSRLGLDIPGLFGWTSTTIENVLVPTRVRSVKNRIVDVALGPNHTVCLTDQGKVITMGQNNDGQLGRGYLKSYSRPHPEIVKSMADKEVTLVATGSSFTVVGTCHMYVSRISCLFLK